METLQGDPWRLVLMDLAGISPQMDLSIASRYAKVLCIGANTFLCTAVQFRRKTMVKTIWDLGTNNVMEKELEENVCNFLPAGKYHNM